MIEEGRTEPGPATRRAFGDASSWCESLLWIRDKRGRVIPLQWNAGQRAADRMERAALRRGAAKRFLYLKSRRIGVTTRMQARGYAGVSNVSGFQAVTLADTKEKTLKIFKMVDLFHQRMPNELRRERASDASTKLEYPSLGSGYFVGTAGATAYGRGDTLQFVHGSEVAYWLKGRADDVVETLIAGLTEAASHGIVCLESTANGDTGYWADLCNEAVGGQNEWTLVFLPWWLDGDCFMPPATYDEALDIANTTDDRERWLINEAWADDLAPLDERQRVLLIAGRLNWRRSKSNERAMRRLFLQEYPETPEEAFLANDDCYFDTVLLDEIARAGYPEPIDVVDNVTYWEKPRDDAEYVVGMDVAEGTPNGDYTSIVVIDNETAKPVARYHGKCRPEQGGVKAVRLARRYNYALLAIERNNHGHSALNTAHGQLHYPRCFRMRRRNRAGKIERVLGWETNALTRPIMLDDLRIAIEEGHMPVVDPVLLAECKSFVNDGKGHYEARSGRHDDVVMSYAIAWQARKIGASVAKVTIL